MGDNTERFTGRVQEYEQFRQQYPAAAILDWLRETCALDAEWRVADVAAGTGMLSEVLLRNGNPVTAVEPNAEMRAVCESLRARWPKLTVVRGTAEAMGLAAGSVAMVTAGRAFHWFEPVLAAAEFRRVLQPAGWAALVSGGRKRDESERGKVFDQLLLEHGTDPEYVERRKMRQAGCGDFLRGLGRPESYRRVAFEEGRRLTFEQFRGTVQSVSCAPLEADPRYDGMQRALRHFFLRWSEGGTLPWVEECVVEAGQLG